MPRLGYRGQDTLAVKLAEDSRHQFNRPQSAPSMLFALRTSGTLSLPAPCGLPESSRRTWLTADTQPAPYHLKIAAFRLSDRQPPPFGVICRGSAIRESQCTKLPRHATLIW